VARARGASSDRMKSTFVKSTGELVASFLTGAWRPIPPPSDISETQLEKIGPLLIRTGAGALAWWRVRHSELESCAVSAEFHQAYRLYTLDSRLNQSKIEKVFALLRSFGVEGILVKGWTAARYYSNPVLRPYGDIDVCVRQRDYENARRALGGLDPLKFKVDLHAGFAKFGLTREEDLYARSELIKLRETDVRIPGPEDHLRVVSYHLMREGAWRPLWLVDVAAALEASHAGFDWNYCLGEKQQARPVVSAITLANILLGARVDALPGSQRPRETPRWLVATVLKEWGTVKPSMRSRQAAPMLSHLRKKGDVLSGLRHRWPNPIEATTTMRGPFNNFPRLPFQVGNSLIRSGEFVRHLLRASLS
jgi:hypothetical protein